MDVFTMKMLGDAWTRTRNAWRTTRVLHPAGLILLIAMLDAAETPQPGLIGEYFAPDRQLSDFPEVAADELPVLVRVDAQINFKSRGGQFYGSALYDHFHVRWTGQLRIEEAGAYTFFLNSDDGSRLLIDGELVADNGGLHNMDDDASGRVELAAGLHELRLDYFEATGGAGCELRWQPPGGEKGLVPAEVLVHSADHTAIRSDAERLAALKKEARALGEGDPNAWYNRMQHGPVIVNSIEIRDWPQENWALKGLAIRLQSGLGRAGVVFDTELLRWAAVTDYGNIELTGIAYDGSHGPSPASAGELVAGTSQAPGIADDGDFADQRPIPFGPMAHARFGGYWLHDQQVVVDYRIGETTVLERPQVVAVGEEAHAFVRSLQVGASTQDLDLLIAESPDGSATAEGLDGSLPLAVRTVGGGELRAAGRRLVLHIPATATPTRIDVILAVTAATLDGLGERELDDLEALTHGGPARWRETVTTSGQLGTEDAAYAVDTITLPESNPYHAKLRLGAFDLFADGRRAAVSTWTGDVWVVDGIDEDLDQLTWRRFATGLFHPLGLRIVDDRIFVLVRDGITELQDLDGDGEADRYRNHNNEVYITKNFHEFAFDLQTDSEGNFYFSKAGPVPPGGRGFDQIVPHHGCLLQVTPDGSELSVVATGLRAPNGIGIIDDETWTSGDNQGSWTPVCRLNLITRDSFMQVPPLAHRETVPTSYGPPICWLPMGVDNSGGGQAVVPHADWGLPQGQLLHSSYGQSSLMVAAYEVVDGVPQGGVVRLPLAFGSGIMRLRFSPVDGQLYVSGLRGWQTNAPREGAFQRVRYTGKPVHVPVAVQVTPSGLAVTFTHELDRESAEDPDFYAFEAWNYHWSQQYGSPELKPSAPNEHGHDSWTIEAVSLREDGRTVDITFAEPPIPVMQYQLTYLLDAADGSEIAQELIGTINVVPSK